MKNKFCMILLALCLCLTACDIRTISRTDETLQDSFSEPADTSENGTTDTTPETSESIPGESGTTETTPETSESIPGESGLLPLPEESMEFAFLSGAGAWRTVLTLNRDGTFTGWFLDSEMGEIGEGYPHGSAYTCTFSGKFVNIERINDYSYKMTLTDLQTEKAVGEEWIEDQIRYVASEPFGLNDPENGQECTEFVFFLPDTPVDQVSEEFLSWWPYRYHQDTASKTTLSCYGILNVATNYGFFT